MEKELQKYYLEALEGNEENKIRQYALKKVLDARASFSTSVKQRMTKLRERIRLQAADRARTNNKTGKDDLISFAEYKAGLDKYREAMTGVYDTNLAALQEIDAYLNRASEVQLLLQGAFQGVREVMGSELKSLGSIGEKLNELTQPLVDSAEDQVRGAAEDLESRGADYLTNLSSDLTSRLREAAQGVENERKKGEETNANRTNRTP